MDSLKICFGKRLKQIRKSKHFTQEKLAECVDINLRQMARIEAGESFVTAETLEKICRVLDTTPDVLFKFPSAISSTNENFAELINKLESILEEKNKIDFLSTALDALNDKNSLEKLKILIQGLELNM